MTETRTDTVRLADGRALRLTIAEPDGVVRGGLVLLDAAHGVTDLVRLLASAFASEGWLAVAPHISRGDDGSVDPSGDHAQDTPGELSGDSVLTDADAAFGWLAERGVSSDLIGVIGFEVGGSAALVVAARRSIGAAVSISARGIVTPLSERIPPLLELAPEIKCPWLGIYGDQDADIDSAEVEKLRDAVVESGVATDVVRFPNANHRFDTDQAGAAEAWQRTLNWFDAHLR